MRCIPLMGIRLRVLFTIKGLVFLFSHFGLFFSLRILTCLSVMPGSYVIAPRVHFLVSFTTTDRCIALIHCFRIATMNILSHLHSTSDNVLPRFGFDSFYTCALASQHILLVSALLPFIPSGC